MDSVGEWREALASLRETGTLEDVDKLYAALKSLVKLSLDLENR